MGPFVRYSFLRLTLLVAVGGVLWVVGARDWLWLLLTAMISVTLSYVLLKLPREQAARAIDDQIAGRRRPGRVTGIDRDADAEDAESGS